MKVVVGLGNPGSQYAGTRHNIGWLVMDRLAERAGWDGRGRQRDNSNVVGGRYRGLDLTLVKPLTYMNDSGLAVRKVLQREHAPLGDLLIVADDFALPFGKLRFREAGSHGGHNGLRSIIDELGTEKFSRLRVGIGDPVRNGRDHVLSKFAPDEVQRLDELLDAAADAVEGMGAGRHEQGGQSLQHVPAARGRRGSPRRSGRGRWAAGRDRRPPDEDRLASRPAAQGQVGRCLNRPRRRCAAAAGGTAASPSRSPRTSRRATRASGTRTPSTSISARWMPRSRTRDGARLRPGDRPRSPDGRRGPHRHHGIGAAHRRGPSPAGPVRPAAAARCDGHVRRAAGTTREPGRHRPGRATRRARRRPARCQVVPGGRHRDRRATRLDRPDAEIGDRVAEELGAWLGDAAAVAVLEPRTALAYERSELVADETAARVAALAAWRSGRARVLVASVQALLQHTIAPDDLPAEPRELRVGARLHQDQLLRDLFDLGYSPVTEVAGRGEFARRGGIVDVFPPSMDLPIRIEFFGDEIDSLRAFDPTDQRTTGTVERIVLLPASEFLLPTGGVAAIRERLGKAVSRLGERLGTDLARFEGAADDPLRPVAAGASRALAVGDAAEVWAAQLAPATGARSHGSRHAPRPRRAGRHRRGRRLPVAPGR